MVGEVFPLQAMKKVNTETLIRFRALAGGNVVNQLSPALAPTHTRAPLRALDRS